VNQKIYVMKIGKTTQPESVSKFNNWAKAVSGKVDDNDVINYFLENPF